MDLSKLIGMVVNTLVRTLVNRGVNAGIDHLARRGKDPAQMTPEEKAQAQGARATAQRARQAAKLAGKIGKPRLWSQSEKSGLRLVDRQATTKCFGVSRALA